MLSSVRLKVTDRCMWACKWCHNEGTGKRGAGGILDSSPNGELTSALHELSNALGVSEVHFTGGEPTLLRSLPAITRAVTSNGYTAKMTSVGSRPDAIPELAYAGLSSINFSLHSLRADELQATQINRSLRWSEVQLGRELSSIDVAMRMGLRVKVNTVVSSVADGGRVLGVLRWAADRGIPVRLLNDLNLDGSSDAIYRILEEIGAERVGTRWSCCESSYTESYVYDGHRVEAKLIRDVYLPAICDHCPLRDRCREKFYGLRMERHTDGYYIRLCLLRSDPEVVMPVDEFVRSDACAQLADGGFDHGYSRSVEVSG